MTRPSWSVLLAKLSIPVYVTEAVVNVVNGAHLSRKEKRRFMRSQDGGTSGEKFSNQLTFLSCRSAIRGIVYFR
jgi:bifunctional DNase/RNase